MDQGSTMRSNSTRVSSSYIRMNRRSGDVREDWGMRTYMPFNTRHPILLPKTHRFTELVVRRFHLRVLQSGAKDTLTELRSKFWIPGGRSLVCQLIKKYVICRRYNASYYCPLPPPPLPVYRVNSFTDGVKIN